MQIFSPDSSSLVAPNVFMTSITGLFFYQSEQHVDNRGYYAELVKIPEINPFCGQPFVPAQMNHSHSKQSVIRGFHAEDWNKLITVIRGECYCVFADFRTDSASFGQTVAMTLGTENSALYGCVYIPSGVGNSSLALSSEVEYIYFVDKLYADRDPRGDVAVSLFDPDLAVDWPLPKDKLTFSERDTQAICLREKYPEKFGA